MLPLERITLSNAAEPFHQLGRKLGERLRPEEISERGDMIQIGRPEIPDRSIDLVTNLGFVRPIDRRLLAQLSSDALVAFMWEPWVALSQDV